MSQPEKPPRFFIDRSLGRKAVPEALRADGWDVITLAEHYGMPADEQVADTDWIKEAAKHGWPVLMKDKRIRHRPAEIAAVTEHKARCFVITRGGATLHHQQGRHPHGSSRAWPVHLLGTDGPDLAPLSVAVPTAISGFRSVRQQHAADLQSLDATRHIFRGKLSEDLVHDLGALDQDRAEFLPVDDLSCP